MATEVHYETVQWKGRLMVPGQVLATGVITLYPPMYARRLYRAGTIGIISPGMWADIQAAKGGDWNVDPAYID
tara:strand:+ start:7777 stop:7995 length:219 start_codon:yes stop_codon:yes gene_type:complete